jgi:hypothetical protein
MIEYIFLMNVIVYIFNIDQYVKIDALNILVNRQIWGFVIVGTDIASILTLFICLIIIIHSQNKEEERFKTKNILISHYTVNVSGIKLPIANINKELNHIIRHFKAV